MSRSFRKPWALLTAGFALHVADEWRTDFLALYNPAVHEIRRAAPMLQLPTFEYDVWLALLGSAVIALAVLTPLAGPGGWGLAIVGRIYSAVMLLNGVGHLTASAWAGEWLSGSVSSPILLAAAAWLWRSLPSVAEARDFHRGKGSEAAGSREYGPAR